MPTNDELRSGAELIADMRSRTPEDSPVIQIALHVWESCLDVADAYLASLPANDGDPVTEEWLLANGWTPKTWNGEQDRWEYQLPTVEHCKGDGSSLTCLLIHRTCDGPEWPTKWWPLEMKTANTIHGEETTVALLMQVNHTTRGIIRQLVAALNITPKAGG